MEGDDVSVALFDSTYAPYVALGSRILTQGSSGTDVAVIQALYNVMLNTMNPPQGAMGTPVAVTGVFDRRTAQAISHTQSYFGIPATGIVDTDTYFLIGQGVDSHTTYRGPAYGSRQLQQGKSGGDVTILQNRLSCFRYASIIGHPANGVFDSATANAVLALKQDAESNGDIGFPSNSIAGFGFYDATWIYTFMGGRTLFTGRNGFDVVFLQNLMEQLGYYTGWITGYFDRATQLAVEAFQSSQGITVDGIVGPTTFYRFGLQNPIGAPKPLKMAWPMVSPRSPLPPITECSTLLSPTSLAPSAYGGVIVISANPGHCSLDVIGNQLPDPASYGASYTAYSFLITNPTGIVIYSSPMREIPTRNGSWSGHLDGIDFPSFKNSSIDVMATNSSGASGAYRFRVYARFHWVREWS